MFEKLRALEEKYNEIENKLTDIAVISDQNQYKALMKERKTLDPIIAKYLEYKKVSQTVTEAENILANETDPELKELANEEYYTGKEELNRIEQELKVLLLPKDENDDRN